jgi:hypothetical protein
VMVIVDKITKLVMFISTRTDMNTVKTVNNFFNHWYRWFGLPKKIISDRDGTFAGPYKIIEVIYPVSNRMQLSVGTNAHETFQASCQKRKYLACDSAAFAYDNEKCRRSYSVCE